jgi:hypothetical protein
MDLRRAVFGGTTPSDCSITTTGSRRSSGKICAVQHAAFIGHIEDLAKPDKLRATEADRYHVLLTAAHSTPHSAAHFTAHFTVDFRAARRQNLRPDCDGTQQFPVM